MTLQFQTGKFQKTTDTTGITITQTIGSLRFTPKAVILYTVGTTGVDPLDGYQIGMGFSDGTNQRSVSTAAKDNVIISTTTGTETSRYISTNYALILINSSGSEVYRCTVSELGFDYFKVDITGNSSATADDICYLAIGGSDITDVKVGSFTVPVGFTSGTLPVTLPDPAFQPDIVFMLGTNQTTSSLNASATGSAFILSAAKSSGEQGVVCNASRHGITTGSSATARYQRNDKCYAAISQTDTTALVSEASFAGVTSTGFNLNYTQAQQNTVVFYLAIKGGIWKVGNFNETTTTGNQGVTSVSFLPQGLLFFSGGRPTETVIQTNARLSFGTAVSSTEQTNITIADRNATTTTRSARATSTIHVYRNISSEAIDATTSTINPQADFISNDSLGFTIHNVVSPADAVSRMLFYVAGQSSVSTTPVSSACKLKYNIQNTITPPSKLKFKYNLGGRVFPNAIITHRYNVLGLVLPSLKIKYDIRNTITKSLMLKYNIAFASTTVTSSLKLKYDIVSSVVSRLKFRYDVEEADIFKTGYGKPLRCKIFVTNPKGDRNIILYNSFHPEQSRYKISNFNVRLAQDSAGDFSISIEDHAKVLDTSVLTPGCKVFVRAAKSEPALASDDKILMWGVIKSVTVIRQDTGTLEYRLEGFGLQVRTNERITNFIYAARKKSFDNPEPDPSDTNMIANNLVKKLLTGTDHLPLGEPLLTGIGLDSTTTDEEGQSIKITDFIPSINEPFTEFSSVMNTLADFTGGVWGVTPQAKLYFRYDTLKHSGITIKDHTDERIDPETGRIILLDDPTKTCYPVGPWSFTDDISKESGFSNRFFAKIARKEQKGNNIINLTAVRDEFTPLFNDEGGDTQTERSPLGVGGPDITSNPSSATAGVYIKGFEGYSVPGAQPGTPEYNQGFGDLANLQRQYPTVKIVAELRVYTSRPSVVTFDEATRIEWVNGITTMKNAGVTVLVRISGDPATLTELQIKADIDAALTHLPNLDGISIVGGNNADETTYKQMYINLVTYIKVNKGCKFAVFTNNSVGLVYQSWLTDMNYDMFMLSTNSSLVPASDRVRSWYSQTPVKRRGVAAYNINVNTGYTDDAVKQWINEYVDQDVAGYFSVVSENDIYSFGAVPSWVGVVAAELQRIQVSGTNTQIVTQPTYRDLAQSFTPTTSDLSDVMLLVSKVGNPKWNEGVNPITGPYRKSDYGFPNYLHGHIESSKTLVYDELNPSTGEIETKVTEQPSGDVVAVFGFPFADIGSQPTTIFLNNVQRTQGSAEIIPGRKYWVVLFGRGQSEDNTIRWHHSDNAADDSISAERSPGGHEVTQNWNVFSKSQSPGFALSYFDRTLDFLEASDSDSIEQYELVESVLDLSFIEDEILGAKFLQTIVNQAAKPKRIYEMNKITAPDELLMPGQLISIIDEMSGHGTSGADQIDAEVVEVEYNFDAYEHPLGCFFLSVRPLGYVDFAYQLWRNKLKRGEIAIPTGEDIVITPPPPPPPPEDGGGGELPPDEEPPHTCPSGQHWDDATATCVPDVVVPPPAAPPDLDVSGILRTRGPFTTYQDFLTACNNAIAGDMIILAGGSYSIPASADTNFTRSGTATNPIIIRAETVGGVTLTGTALYHFNNCDYMTWYGFIHRGDLGADDTEILIDSGSTNVRIARCDISLNDGSGATRNHYLRFSNAYKCRVDHCYFHDKDTDGYYIGSGYDNSVPVGDGCIIEYNRFRNHTSDNSDSGECIVLGASAEARLAHRITVRYNFFDNNTGDGEVCANKSCHNIFYHNSFINNDAALSLRHGDTITVVGNYFENTGLRLGGKDNIIANNCCVDNSRTNSARKCFVLQTGTVDSPTSGTGYERVVNNTIVYNTFANGTGTASPVVGWGSYDQGSLVPTGNLFRGNIITGQNGTLFSFDGGSSASGNTFSDNIAYATSNATYGDVTTGMADRINPQLTRDSDSVYRITDSNSNAYGHVSPSTNPLSSTTTEDFDGQNRTGRGDAGSDHYSTATRPNKRITATDVGPSASTTIGAAPPTDAFGVPKKYPDSTLTAKPATFEMGFGNYASRIRQWTAGSGTGFQGSGTSTYFDSDQGTSNVRWIVYGGQDITYTVPSYSRNTILNNVDTDDSVKRGGLMASGGNAENWRDIEITHCIYHYNMSGDNTSGWFARGGTHSGSGAVGVSCEGSAYHPDIFYATGDSEVAKEMWHVSYASGRTPDSKTVIGSCVGQWVWFKTIFRNMPASGAYASPNASVPHIPVKMELYAIRTGLTDPAVLPPVSTAANVANWVKVMEKTDSGGWGTTGGDGDCAPGPADTIFSYGGPEVTFRADRDSASTGYGHLRVAYVSVREINPSAAAYW